MTITKVQYDLNSNGGTSPFTFALGAGPTSGNLLLVTLVGADSTGPACDAPPAGWTELYRDSKISVFWKISDGTEGTTPSFTFTGVGTAIRGWLTELNGAESPSSFSIGADFSGKQSILAAVNSGPWSGMYAFAQMTTFSSIVGGGEQVTNRWVLPESGSSRTIGAERIYLQAEPISTTFIWDTNRSGRYVIVTVKPSNYSPDVVPSRDSGRMLGIGTKTGVSH